MDVQTRDLPSVIEALKISIDADARDITSARKQLDVAKSNNQHGVIMWNNIINSISSRKSSKESALAVLQVN